MTSKERAKLKAQAMKMDSIFQIGKASLTPQIVNAVRNALEARGLIKISVLKNCADNPAELASLVSERTGSQVVQVIGKKIILYKKNVKKEEKRNQAQKQQNVKKKTASQTDGRRDKPFLPREKNRQDKEKAFEIKNKKQAMREKKWIRQERSRKPDKRDEKTAPKISWKGNSKIAAFQREAKKQGRYGRKPTTQTKSRKWGSRNG